jgi:PKD repeat protein
MITALLAAMLLQTTDANPYVTVSAIDTSGGIVASRTSGQTPMFLQVSASNITATGTDRPFEDLTYSWDFGDELSEPILHPITGEVVDAGTQQTGPEAAYVYRQPGTYTITLTVSGSGITETVTQTVTVTQHVPSQTIYYDSVNGDNANDGSTPETAMRSFGGAVIAPNVVYSFARGGTYSLPHIPAWRNGWRWMAHGQGEQPVLQCNGFDGFYINASNVHDMVFSDVHLKQGNASHIVFINAGEGEVSNVYWDRCTVTANPDRTVDSSIAFHLYRRVVGFGLWQTKIDMGDQFTSGEYLGSFQGDWRFMLGVEMANGVGDAVRKGRQTTHNYYSGDEDHQLLRWCALGTGRTVNRLSNVKINSDYNPSQYFVADENLLRGKWMFFGTGTNRSSYPEDVIVSGNLMKDVTPYATDPKYANTQYEVAWLKKGNRFTMRDNQIEVGRNIIAWVAGAGGELPIRPQLYRNGTLEGGTISAPNGYSRDNYIIGNPVPDPTPDPEPTPEPEPQPVGSELLLKLKLDADGNVIGVQIIKDAK